MTHCLSCVLITRLPESKCSNAQLFFFFKSLARPWWCHGVQQSGDAGRLCMYWHAHLYVRHPIMDRISVIGVAQQHWKWIYTSSSAALFGCRGLLRQISRQAFHQVASVLQGANIFQHNEHNDLLNLQCLFFLLQYTKTKSTFIKSALKKSCHVASSRQMCKHSSQGVV